MKQTKLFSVMAVAVACCVASCGNMNNKPETNAVAEKNKEAMMKVNEMFTTGNSTGIENYVADNVVDHSPMPEIKSTGVQALKDMIAMQHAAFPDMKSTIYSVMADGDKVVMHYNMKGNNSGAMGMMPATNKMIDVDGVDIVRFENGKAVEHWGYMEEAKMMTQMGMMPDKSKMMPTTAANETAKPEEKK